MIAAYFSLTRARARQAITQWGIGSMTGHHVIAFRDPTDNELYVHESTSVPPGTKP